MEQADKAKAQVYLRGFIKDSFKQTVIESSEIIGESSPGFVLEPKMFEKFKIDKVPAVVFEEKGMNQMIFGKQIKGERIEYVQHLYSGNII